MNSTQNKSKRSQPYRFIDVHNHMFPPDYVSALARIGITGARVLDFPKWTPQKSLSIMDRNGISRAIMSISTPGVYFGDKSFSRDLARRCNEYAAQLISDYPDRVGAFATLPLPDVEGALTELEYALDTLKLDGVVLLSNVEGHYLGDPTYGELFAELNRRKTVVFIHPHDLPYREGEPVILAPLFERMVDTTRTVTDLLYEGTLKRYPNIRYILAHGGGSVPFLAWRIALGQSAEAKGTSYDQGLCDYTASQSTVNEGIEVLKRLYYDTAQPGPSLMRAVQELAGPSHILCGTDCGPATATQVALSIDGLKEYDGFNEQDFAEVERNNALELFPRFKNNGGFEK